MPAVRDGDPLRGAEVILTCVVTYNRLAYTKRCIESLLATARPLDRIVIVDNASTDGTQDWLRSVGLPVIANEVNRYPGYATNQGWDYGLVSDPDFLHRSDNDIEYLPGWQDEVERAFADFPELALLGILNLHEDGKREGEGIDNVPRVGGNVVMPTRLFRDGLRWDERPWAKGIDEDGPMSWAAKERGWVARLRKTVANNMAFGRYADYPDYYDRTALDRGYPDPAVTV